MSEKCRGCDREKGAFVCVLILSIDFYPDNKIDCPCFDCLVKVMCREQCDQRKTYFLQNAEIIKIP
jgi:hypothetical protein